jgi:hypothetical protein
MQTCSAANNQTMYAMAGAGWRALHAAPPRLRCERHIGVLTYMYDDGTCTEFSQPTTMRCR